MDNAIRELQEAIKRLEAIRDKKAYSIAEVKEVRQLLFGVVREELDPRAFGHMPDKRYY